MRTEGVEDGGVRTERVEDGGVAEDDGVAEEDGVAENDVCTGSARAAGVLQLGAVSPSEVCSSRVEENWEAWEGGRW